MFWANVGAGFKPAHAIDLRVFLRYGLCVQYGLAKHGQGKKPAPTKGKGVEDRLFFVCFIYAKEFIYY